MFLEGNKKNKKKTRERQKLCNSVHIFATEPVVARSSCRKYVIKICTISKNLTKNLSDKICVKTNQSDLTAKINILGILLLFYKSYLFLIISHHLRQKKCTYWTITFQK